jgi:hypothetical protein
VSRTRNSTVEDLLHGTKLSVETVHSLENLLRLLQHLELRKIPSQSVEEIRFLAPGETFQVHECVVGSTVVAVKRLQLHDRLDESSPEYFPRRLQAVVREIVIMSHPLVIHYLNIVSLQAFVDWKPL